MTIIDFLKERADRNADDIAFRFLGNGDLDGPITEWTFKELYQQSAGVAEDLTAKGLDKTSVLLAFPPGLDFVKAFYGCLLAGSRAVPVPLPNPRSKSPLGRIINTASACEASTAITTQPLAEMVSSMAPDLPVKLTPVTDKIAEEWEGPKAKLDQVAYLQFTSGSTGHPKGVAVCHSNAVANLRVMGQMLRIKSTEPAIVWAPHYHDLCLVGHVLGPVYYGFESILMSPLDFLKKPVRWLRAISHYKVANTACPNFGYEYATRRIKPGECEGLDLSRWKIAGNGGEPVLKDTLDKFADKFGQYGFKPQASMPCYGMAESVLFVAGLKPLDQPPKILKLGAKELEQHTVRILNETEKDERTVISCGSPVTGHSVIAVDPATLKKSDPDKIGELWTKGPSVPSCYWGLTEESKATFEGYLADTGDGPYLRTGDLGFVKDGEVYVTGRLKDMIIIAGRNHYPSDIENTVQQSGAPVRPGACSAVAQTVNGIEELIIIAEINERELPESIKPEDLEGHDAGSEPMKSFWLSAIKSIQGSVTQVHGLSIKNIVFVKAKSLEKTSSGKPRRQYYKDLYQKNKLAKIHESLIN